MRSLVCLVLFVLCVAVIPEANCDRKYKVSEFNERDRRETRERYARRDDDSQKYRRSKYSDEDYSVSRSRKNRREEADDEAPQRGRDYKRLNDEKKFRARKLDESDEDYTDETGEDLSESCVDKRGRKCESDDLTDEDYTDEDSDDVTVKKRVIYIKKFAHEKNNKKKDKEAGSILKMHKKAGSFRTDDDDTTSEEIAPKRRRFIYDDEEE